MNDKAVCRSAPATTGLLMTGPLISPIWFVTHFTVEEVSLKILMKRTLIYHHTRIVFENKYPATQENTIIRAVSENIFSETIPLSRFCGRAPSS